MPIEIRELHIRVAVNATPASTARGGPSAPSTNGGRADMGEVEELVAECVERVLQILQSREER